MRAALETGSTSSTRSSAPRSSVTVRHVVVADARLDSADDAGATAVGDHCCSLVGTPVEHRLDLALVARPGNEVGRMLDLTAHAADDVAVGLAERM